MQHAWAELSEKLSDLYGPNIKYGGGEEDIRSLLDTSSTSAARIEALESELREQEARLTSPGEETRIAVQNRIDRVRVTIAELEGSLLEALNEAISKLRDQ